MPKIASWPIDKQLYVVAGAAAVLHKIMMVQ